MTDEQVFAFWREIHRQRDLELERRARQNAQHERALQDSEDARIKREKLRQERSR